MVKRGRARRVLLWSVGSVLALVLLSAAGLLVYAQIGRFDATPGPLAAVRASDDVTLVDRGDAWVLAPVADADGTGLVFVPGAKVDPLAYASMLQPIAADGTTVVIVKPPLGLAILDLRSAEQFTALAPAATTWAVGGHSLGGVKACQWAADGTVDALVLFGSYCASDLSGTDVRVLSIAGSADGLSTAEKIADARHLLPPDADMQVIDGASHASFGAYGPQPGDGTPTISEPAAHTAIDDLVTGFLDTLRD